jgi:NAD-dependent deacetylase
MKNKSLADARAIIRKARCVATFSGAGLSAESGLATFRDPETDALWTRFRPADLASIDGFEENPKRVSDWYRWRRSQYAKVTPNPAHLALAGQENLTHITPNVDNLLEQAGATRSKVLHLHGTITRDHCHAACGYEEEINMQNPPVLRRCPNCKAYMRPSVVWFGERLPPDVWVSAEAVCRRADCLIVVGTSATVTPAANLIEVVSGQGGHIIVINTKSDETRRAHTTKLIGPAGELLPVLLQGIDINSNQ